MEKVPLVVFSPMPPQRNGIADYVGELAPSLQEHYDCIYVTSDDVANIKINDKNSLISEQAYYKEYSEYENSVHIYHLGNNEDHIHCLKAAMKTPGVLVMHDLTLHYLYDRATVGGGNPAEYCRQLTRELGQPGQVLGRQFELSGWRGQHMFYSARLCHQLVARSKSVIVHSAYGEAKIRAMRGAPEVHRIPHHATPVRETNVPSREAARRRLNIPQDALVFISPGFVTRAKQIALVLSVLGGIRQQLPPFRFLIAGAADSYANLAAEIDAVGLTDVTERRGFVAEADLTDYLVAADIVLNLRYPSGGETSGTLLRALAAGACTVITDVGAFSEFPDDCVAKVAWGPNVAADLARTIIGLASTPDARTRIGARARDYVAANHSIQASAALYRAAIDQAGRTAAAPWAVSGTWEYATKIPRTVGDGAGAAPWYALLLPRVTSEARLAGVSRSASVFGAALAGYQARRWDPGSEAANRITRAFDLILHGIPGPTDRDELARTCRDANRFLKFGGLLIILSQPADRTASKAELAALLFECGFRLDEYLETTRGPEIPTAARDRGGWGVRATKITEYAPVPVRIPAKQPSGTNRGSV